MSNINVSDCPICGTPVEFGELRTVCPSCQIVFHQECWLENKGCSTYGCSQVNVLNPPIIIPPDIGVRNQDDGVVDYNPPQIHPTLQKIKFVFCCYWISALLCEVLAFFVGVAGVEPTMLIFYSLIFSIPWTIFGCMLFYRLWNVTDQNVGEKTRPFAATAAFFIPFYYIYWFPAGLYKLADKINQTLTVRGNAPLANPILGGWAGGLWIIKSFITRIPSTEGQLCAGFLEVMGIILFVVYYLSCIKGAEQILNNNSR
ncbi:MAG: hypothetical protein LBG58_07650 [Planctomycetaceae bacterium]|jgi:hypothetical protein|nr:hypothetical protein [Planctomycetaceae bacterium]